jgi:hypothetical protein
LYQKGCSLTTGDTLLEPLPDRIGEVYGFATEVDPRQAVPAFEILNDMMVIRGAADLRDAEKPNQFSLGHDCGADDECTIWTWQNSRQFEVSRSVGHSGPPGIFSEVSTKQNAGHRRREVRAILVLPMR